MKPTNDIEQMRMVRVLNGTTEIIPPGAVVYLQSANIDGVFTGIKPTTENLTEVVFNGAGQIAIGAEGVCFAEGIVFSSLNPADAAPAVGEIRGVKANDWNLRSGQTGFRLLSSTTDKRFAMVSKQDSASGTDTTEFLQITSSTAVSGWYPAYLFKLNTTTGVWSLDPSVTVYARDPVGTALVVGQEFPAIYGGVSGGFKRYAVTPPTVPDASHTVAGKVNLSNQYLGAGIKLVDYLGLGDGAGTLGSGIGYAAPTFAGYPAQVSASTYHLLAGAYRAADSARSGGTCGFRPYQAIPGAASFITGISFFRDQGSGDYDIFRAYSSITGLGTIESDSLYCDSGKVHAGWYSVRYGSTILQGASSIGYDTGAATNNTMGLNFIHGLYIGGDLSVSSVSAGGSNNVSFGSTTR